ncbi:MAG: HEAT repeat domain-containing protein [Bradymonadales bacterium]|nr:HEAT repeat domain-containing protein [Bradymonadales bacterium]
MTSFDPTRILAMAQCLESGTTQQKLDLIAHIDSGDPITAGMVMRALADQESSVRLAALEKLEEGGLRPPNPLMGALLQDDDPQVRHLATRLSQRPDTLNPLEKVVPLIESMASSLGPLGGLLKSMIETLRNLGEENERDQLIAVSRLTDDNPAAMLAIVQALQSPHLAVRLSALRKALYLTSVTVPDEMIQEFLSDPSAEVREATDALILAGKVGPFDAESFRAQAMQSMVSSLMGNLSLSGLDFSSLLGSDLDSTALFGQMGEVEQPAPPTRAPDHAPDAGGEIHQPDGFIYLVCDLKTRDRILRILAALSDREQAPACEQIEHPSSPPRWAVRGVEEPTPEPSWPSLLAERGMNIEQRHITWGEQARMLSEQIWGAAYADLTGEIPLTLVFHDGVLSAGHWGGETPGTWYPQQEHPTPVEGTPLALLKGFLADPTDDRLIALPQSDDPLLVAG